jgi:hypothetical protein
MSLPGKIPLTLEDEYLLPHVLASGTSAYLRDEPGRGENEGFQGKPRKNINFLCLLM